MNTPPNRIIKGQVFFEFTVIGNSIKVVAIDEATGIEVTVVGSQGVSQEHMQRLALRKLEKRINELRG